jgi:hypothetical protein
MISVLLVQILFLRQNFLFPEIIPCSVEQELPLTAYADNTTYHGLSVLASPHSELRE